MNCLIVDDEPIAREILEAYCGHFPELRVVGSCSNALQAREVLGRASVDVLFLDINMPVLDGLSFIKTLKQRPQIILTTAYREYAAEAFELEVVDYLVKPFSLERFVIALDKIRKPTLPVAVAEEDRQLYIKADGKIFKIDTNEIIYAEAHGNYTLITTEVQTLKSPMTFSTFEALLPASQFERVHRSFLIQTAKLSYIDGNRIFLGKHEVPLGQSYRESFLKKLKL